MPKTTEEPIMRVEIHPLEKPKSYDDQVRGILGISLQQLIMDIKKNEGGKYDYLYT